MSYLLVVVPFFTIILINLLPKKVREPISFFVLLAIFTIEIVAVFLLPFKFFSSMTLFKFQQIFGFNFYLEKIGIVLLLSAGLVFLSALFVSRFTIKSEEARFNLKNLLLIALIGVNGIALVTDIFSLYVFIEITAIASFILISLFGGRDAYEATWKYLVLSVIASVLMLSAIALLLFISTGTSFGEIRIGLESSSSSFIPKLAVALFISGLFIKGGLVPFHGWLPDAYSAAPASVSVLLAGIITKAVGIYALIRILTGVVGLTAPLQTILLIIGTISILIGAFAAIGQGNMKRMLAYSSISQIGYIIVGLGVGTKLGLFAAMFHFFNHAVFKAQLFANAAALEEKLGKTDMEGMGGLAEKMPVTGVTSILASLSTAGVPPLSGFWSKFLIIVALWLGGYYVYAVIAVTASVITLAYFLTLQRRVFFGKLPPELEGVKEVSFGLLAPALLLSGITVLVGLLFPFAWRVFVG